ncbi:hypothetical protein DICPUDRAFT_37434 [Dictyostelium purpureum]|uniref:Uncharacterized protein n=1 Tax=Dictyostelium purpureum TaxID=5786 RepID=F0ZSU3_DICPU|nr:uncharacterized protein DICPUDRAFT_37434 [Dictyostelium purpureum]EGC32968.1 hypothetical protein DICPUDRAFT_37434 [Dictyostelium purpureum]|eukprot:XP_003290486.1 hypothetical protein DICPUDRAFT_37434 [Dictyostelium purpureum]
MSERKKVTKLITPTAKKNVKYIESWKGYEHLKEKLIKASNDYVDASDVVYRLCGGEKLIHNTIAAMNGNISNIKPDDVQPSIDAAQKLTELSNLCAILIHKHYISPTLVNDIKNSIIE